MHNRALLTLLALALAASVSACGPNRIEPEALEAARVACERAPDACEGWRWDR